MLKIERKSDGRVVKAIMHRVADIAGGVTVKTADLGGSTLLEGTPLCKGENGLYEVVRTGVVVTKYTDGASNKSIEVAKGSHFRAEDIITAEGSGLYATVVSVNRTAADKDVITISARFNANIEKGTKLVLVAAAATDETHGAVVNGAVAGTDKTSFNVDKGHTIAVGDYVASTKESDGMTGKLITNIDRGSDAFDTVTIGAANGKALADNEELVVVTASNGTTAKEFPVYTKQGEAVAVTGSNYSIGNSENIFVDAWVKAVVYEAVAPVVTAEIKAQLSGVIYV